VNNRYGILEMKEEEWNDGIREETTHKRIRRESYRGRRDPRLSRHEFFFALP